MSWKFDKFYGLGDFGTAIALTLDRCFQQIQTASPYIQLTNKRFIDATAGAQSVMLTDGSITTQDQFILKTDGSANAVVIYPYGTQTINGAASYTLAAQYNKVTLTFYVDRWYVVAT